MSAFTSILGMVRSRFLSANMTSSLNSEIQNNIVSKKLNDKNANEDRLLTLSKSLVTLRNLKPFAEPNASIPELCSKMRCSDRETERMLEDYLKLDKTENLKEWGFTTAFLPFINADRFKYDSSEEKFQNTLNPYLSLLDPEMLRLDKSNASLRNPSETEFELESKMMDWVENVEKAIFMEALFETYERPTQVSQETLLAFDEVVAFFPEAHSIVESILLDQKNNHTLDRLESDINSGVLIEPKHYPQLHHLALTLFYQKRITVYEFCDVLLFSASLMERGEDGYQFISMKSNHPHALAIYHHLDGTRTGLSPAKKVFFQMLVNKLPDNQQNILIFPATKEEASSNSNSNNITNVLRDAEYKSFSLIESSDGKQYRVVVPLGMMQAYVDAKDGLNSVLLTPRIDFSTFARIRLTRTQASHDVAYPFEGLQRPEQIDSRDVAYSTDVVLHDFYHARVLGNIPHQDRLYLIQKHDALKLTLEKNRSRLSEKAQSITEEFLKRVVDMEFANDYSSLHTLRINTQFHNNKPDEALDKLKELMRRYDGFAKIRYHEFVRLVEDAE